MNFVNIIITIIYTHTHPRWMDGGSVLGQEYYLHNNEPHQWTVAIYIRGVIVV